MNSNNSVKVKFDALRSLAFGGLGPAYVSVGPSFTNPIRLLKISNATDANIIVSFNGVVDHDFVAANGFSLYDFTSNKSSTGGVFQQGIGETVFVKEEAAVATEGTVYVTAIYASSSI